jgi:hypothetical protein
MRYLFVLDPAIFTSNTPDSAILLSYDQVPSSSSQSMGNNPVAEAREGVP